MIKTGSIVIENEKTKAMFVVEAPDDHGHITIHSNDDVDIPGIPFDELLEVLKLFAKQAKS